MLVYADLNLRIPSSLSVGNRKLKQYKTTLAHRCNNSWNRSMAFPRNVSGQRVNTPTSTCAYGSHCPLSGDPGQVTKSVCS